MNNGITILIVDDEDSYTDALRRLFGADGYEVQLANNLAEGLGKIAQKVFDLVITDLSLGGLEILRAAKAKNRKPKSSLSLVTALSHRLSKRPKPGLFILSKSRLSRSRFSS